MMDLQREKRLFLLMLRWKYFIDRPDVIHFHSYGAGLEYVLQWANLHKFPTVYQEHSTPDLTKRDWYSLPTDLNKASIVVAVSEASAKALIHLCDVHRPIRIIPPIASIKFNGNHEKRCFCPDKKNIQIITLSRLSEEKGLPYLIDAAEMVLPERASITFNIYGEGPLRASLEDMIKNKKLAEHVFLRGKYTRDKLNEIMRDADIYLLPSVTEGLPLALIEAMAWGLPIVATGVGGIPELIEDGTSGLLCEPKNSTSLAQAIISLIKDPPLALKLGTIAQDIYQEKFTAEHILGQFDEAYFQALKN
jgi:glycosyltransferase involved in cell wall biosynthesis